MRKSMKQRVALFLSFAMAFTSVDSSALVAASDTTEVVSEEAQQEEAVAEEAGVQQEDAAVEEVAVQNEEELAEPLAEVDVPENEDGEAYSSDEEDAQDEELVEEANDEEALIIEETETLDEEEAVYADDAVPEDEEQLIGDETIQTDEEAEKNNATVSDVETQDIYGDTLHIENDDGHQEKVLPGQGITLTADEAWSDLGTQITYAWHKDGDWEKVLSSEKTLVIESVNKAEVYYCTYSDGSDSISIRYEVRIDAGIEIDTYQMFDNVKSGDRVEMLMIDEEAIPDGITLTYQWYHQERQIGENKLLSGETKNRYTAIAGDYNEHYQCVATDNYGNVYCKDFYWYIDTLKIDYGKMKDRVVVPMNGSTILAVYASSSLGEVTYSWEKYDSESDCYIKIENETASTLELNDVTTPGNYGCNVSDGNSSMTVNFTVCVDVGVVVEGYQYCGEKEPGETVAMRMADVIPDGVILNFKWYRFNRKTGDYDIEVEEAKENIYSVPVENCSEMYKCEASDQYGNTYIKYFQYNVPTITIDWDEIQSNVTVPMGGAIILKVSASTTRAEEIQYSWEKYDFANEEWKTLEGKTESSLQVDNVTKQEKYQCLLMDGNEGAYVGFTVSIDAGIVIGENVDFDNKEPGDTVTMQMADVIPEGVTLDFKWYRYNRETESYDIEIEEAKENCYSVTVGECGEIYMCVAVDQYEQVYRRFFEYHVQTMTIDWDNMQTDMTTPVSGSVVLEMFASTIRAEGIQYSWEKYDPESDSANEDGWVKLEGKTESSLQVDNVTKQEKYQCVLDDGNEKRYCEFTVSIDVGVVIGENENFGEKEPGDTVTMQMAEEIPDGVSLNFKWYCFNKETYKYDIISEAKENQYSVIVGDCDRIFLCEANDQYGNTYRKSFNYYVDTLSADCENSVIAVPFNGTATLVVFASTIREAGVHYSWRKYDPENESADEDGWVKLEGKTASSLQVDNVTGQEKYQCYLDDGNRSAYFEFTVTIDIGFEFINNPTDMFGAVGDQIVLDAEATVKEGSLSYQWYRYEDEAGYVLIPDAVTSQYTATVEEGEVEYQCVVTDIYDGVHVRYMYVRPDHSITIENSYNEQSVKPEEKVTMSVNASTKAGTLSYQWQVRNNAYEWEDISDATDASYTVEIVDNLYYRCIVSNGYEGEDQEAQWLFSIDSGLEIGEVDNQFNIEIGQNVTVTLTMNATTEYGKLTYKWEKSSRNINGGSTETIKGATDSTYTVENIQKSETYYCIVSNGYESFEQPYYIYVYSGLEVSAENTEVYVKKGETATLKVNATSNYLVTYKWYTQEKVDDEYIYVEMGNETDTCVTSPATGYKEYVCVVSDGYNTEYWHFNLHIDNGFRVSAEQAAVWVAKGTDAELKVNASIYEEYGDLTYQWYNLGEYDEWQRIDGATDATYTAKNITEIQAYRCRVETEDEESEDVYFSVGPEEVKENYALDFSTAKILNENAENLAVIPVVGSGAYFKFIPNRTGVWEIYSKTDEDTKAYLYDASAKQIAYNDDGEEDTNFCLRETLERGNTYYIQCRYYEATQTGSYPVFVRYVGNDESEEHSWDDGTITQQPTCEIAGVKTYVCVNCGETRTEEIAAIGHDYPESWTVRKSATCTENGVQYRVCNNCEKEETEEIAATGHIYGEVQTVAATETENGKKYQTCTECDSEKILEVIPATGIAKKVDAVKDTVSKLDDETTTGADLSDAIDAIKEMDNQTMIDMDAAEDESAKTDLNGLVTKVEEKILASEDLTDAGIQGTIGETVISDEKETAISGATAMGAAVTVASVVKEAGFTQQEGAKYQAQIQVKEKEDSSVENGVYKVDISMNILKTVGETTTTAKSDVQPVAPVKIAMPIPAQFQNAQFTLEHNGKAVAYTLSEDGKSISFYAPSFSPWEMKIQKCAEGKHNYVEAKEDSAWENATHTETGMKVEVCSICNDRKETTIPKTDHKWSDWKTKKEASCTENGTKERTCELCSQTETADILKTGHSMEWKVDQEATCVEEGSQHQECTICHIKGTVAEIPATANHNMQLIAAKEATCTEAGNKAYWICNTCKKLYTDADGAQETTDGDQVIPAKGHKWETKVDKAATCGAAGSQHRECSVCHTKEEATAIPANGEHNMQVKVDKEATCGAVGSQHKECSVCHTKEAATTIPAKEHKWETKIDKAATCGATGSQHRECSVCHTKEPATIIRATDEHSFGGYAVTKEATALATGTETRTCKVCGKTESRSIARLTATIKITANKVTVKVGDSAEVGKYVTGLAKGDSVAGYTSSDEKNAIVNSAGRVTGKAVGSAVITVKLASGKTADITVTVQKKEIATKSIKNLSKTMKMKVKGTVRLKPVISPSNTTDKLTYSSSDKKVVTVSAKGKLTAKKAGKAKITVKSGKKKFTITVTVAAPTPTGMKNVPTSKKLAKGKSFALKPTLLPAGAKGKITYKTSNKKVATVDAKGKVTAKKKGTAVITVTVGKIKKTCKVTVK